MNLSPALPPSYILSKVCRSHTHTAPAIWRWVPTLHLPGMLPEAKRKRAQASSTHPQLPSGLGNLAPDL